MARRLFITGTDTGVGKTVLGCALAFALRARGYRVGVMKPAETGCEQRDDELIPADAVALKFASGSDLPLDLICPCRYASPLAPAAAAERDGLPAPNLEQIRRDLGRIEADSDMVIVEGAGGITVPLTWQKNYADLATLLELEVVLVIGNRLGCINAALLTLDYCARRNLKMVGYVLNDIEPAESPAAQTNAASLAKATDVPSLGTIAWKEPVRREVIQRIAGDLMRD